MMRHVLAMGHRRIAFISGAAGNVDADERRRGYRSALKAAHVERDRLLEIDGDFTECGGYEAAKALLRLSQRPTAVFAANDSMAIGALSALREAGVSVPEEIAVTGFDDIPIAQYTSPPLTSVHVPILDLGERATERLVDSLSTDRRRRRSCETLPTTLVVRQSCGGAKLNNEFKRANGARVSSPQEVGT